MRNPAPPPQLPRCVLIAAIAGVLHVAVFALIGAGIRWIYVTDLHLSDPAIFGLCLIGLVLVFIVPYCLGRISGRYACVAAVAYSGSFALTTVGITLVMDPGSHSTYQAPGTFTGCFGMLLVGSIPFALLGAFCRRFAAAFRRRLPQNSAVVRADAIQVGTRFSESNRIDTPVTWSARPDDSRY
jgi:hypothetical protein